MRPGWPAATPGRSVTVPSPVDGTRTRPSLALVGPGRACRRGSDQPTRVADLTSRASPCGRARFDHGLVGRDSRRSGRGSGAGSRCCRRTRSTAPARPAAWRRRSPADDEPRHAAVVPPTHLDDVARRGPEQAGRRGAEDHLAVAQHTCRRACRTARWPTRGRPPRRLSGTGAPGGAARTSRRCGRGAVTPRVPPWSRAAPAPTSAAAANAAVCTAGSRLRDCETVMRAVTGPGTPGQDRGWGRRGAGGADEHDGGHQGPPPRDGDAGRRAGAWEGRQGP